MKYKVEILPSAWEHLKIIEDYYIIQFDVQTALKVSDHILDTIERLEQFPDSGSFTPDDWLNEHTPFLQVYGHADEPCHFISF